ncbi:MAG: murein biosynthesis integral membrane protein MurJ [Planctomycetota bacterium]
MPPDAEPQAADAIVDRHRGLVGRTALVSGLTLLSRILGFVREVLAAALFGDQSAVWDAFVTAWRVPNLFRRFFGEGAISTSLQTALTEADAEGGDEAGRRLFLRTVARMTLVLSAVCLVAMGVATVLPDAWLGADPQPVRELIVRLMPFVLLICLAAICGGALQVRGHFTAPNLAPALMNLVWIGALLWIGAHYVWGEPVPAGGEALKPYQLGMARVLAWGALLSGAVQLAVQVPALARTGLLFRRADAGPDAEPRHTAGSVLWASVPLALGAAVYQINVMIDGFMAEALLRDGAPTAHYLANRVQQFPLALIALAATSAVFPSLKALGHRGRLEELRDLHDRAQLGVAFLALPASVGLFLLAQPIASVLFEHGSYGPDGVARVAAALRMLALALLPAGAVGLVSRTYYALGDMRTPVRVSVVALTVNVALNVGLVVGLGMDVDGLALATAVTSWVQLAWLLPGLTRRHGLPASAVGAARRVAVVALAAAGSGALALAAHRGVGVAFGLSGAELSRSALALGAAAVAGMGGFLALARALRAPEWDELRARRAARRSGKAS